MLSLDKSTRVTLVIGATLIALALISRGVVAVALEPVEPEVVVREVPVQGEVIVELPDGEIMSSTFGPDAERVVLSSDDVFVMLSIGEEEEEPVDLSRWEPGEGTESEEG